MNITETKSFTTKDGTILQASEIERIEILGHKGESYSGWAWTGAIVATLFFFLLFLIIAYMAYRCATKQQYYVKVFFKDGTTKCLWVDEETKFELQSV